jgi:hypothetical protein
MSSIEFICSNCHLPVLMQVGQTIRNRKISWYGSYICSNCGNTEEQDDTGLPSPEIRDVILDEEGQYKLYTDDINTKAKILKVIKQSLNLKNADLTSILARLPGIFIEGTKTEMEWIQQLLGVENVNTNLIKPEQKESDDLI